MHEQQQHILSKNLTCTSRVLANTSPKTLPAPLLLARQPSVCVATFPHGPLTRKARDCPAEYHLGKTSYALYCCCIHIYSRCAGPAAYVRWRTIRRLQQYLWFWDKRTNPPRCQTFDNNSNDVNRIKNTRNNNNSNNNAITSAEQSRTTTGPFWYRLCAN